MLVKCEQDGIIFKAVILPYPNNARQSTIYTASGDEYIDCPKCGRRYFKDDEFNGQFHSDRLLTIIQA